MIPELIIPIILIIIGIYIKGKYGNEKNKS